jgi:protein O-mannosyl-transferase
MSSKKLSRKRETQRTNRTWIGASLALLLITFLAYANSFKVPLVFDDFVTIQRNTSVRFGEFSWNLLFGRALLYLTFTLNYLWSGQNVWTYHLVNFLFHFVNGILVLVLAERIFRHVEETPQRRWQYAGLAAAFFLVHTVQTESVTYISSRSELLSTFFYLSGLLLFVLWPRQRIGFLCSLAVGVAYFFGLGSKETVITLPASILVYDFLFLSKGEFRPIASRWRFYVTYVVGAGAVMYYLLFVDISLRGSIGANVPGNLPTSHYFLTELRVIARYIRLLFLPWGLNLDYDFRPSTSIFEPYVILSFLFLCSLVVLAWMLRRRQPVFAFSIFWFFITLSPTSSVVPIADVIFEHRLYLPLIGVCLSFPFFVTLVYATVRKRVSVPGNPFAYSCILLMALTVGTIVRNYTWGDEVRLFQDIVSKSPYKNRPYNGLAFAYYKRGEFDPAIEVLQKALERMPDKLVELSDTLANLYLKKGRHAEAIRLFETTTRSLKGERLALAYNNMGVAYLYMWNDLQVRRAQLPADEFAMKREQILKPAAEAFAKGLEIENDMPWALDSYVNVMCYRDKAGEMEAASLERLKQKETFGDLYTIGKIAFNRGDYAKADEYFERAENKRKDIKILFFNHGYTLTQLKQDDRAAEKYIQAIRVDPIFIEAHHNLGLIYMRKGEFAKAAEAFAEVLRQDPKHLSSNLNLASVYIHQGNKALARSYLNTVLEVSPGNSQAASMLAQLGS